MSHMPPVPKDQQSDKVIGAHSPPDISPEVTQRPQGSGPQGKAADRQREMHQSPQTQDR